MYGRSFMHIYVYGRYIEEVDQQIYEVYIYGRCIEEVDQQIYEIYIYMEGVSCIYVYIYIYMDDILKKFSLPLCDAKRRSHNGESKVN